MIYTIGCSVGNRSTVNDCLSYFKDKEEIQIDTETTGRDCHSDRIISLQIGDTDNQWFIDTREKDIKQFKDLLESKKCLAQNAKFDYKMLKSNGILLNKIYDTMIAECVLYCGYKDWGYGLDKLVKRYLNIEMSKEERVTFLHQGNKEFTLEQVEYGAKDVTYLQDIRNKQVILAKVHELEYCINLENEVIKALGDIEYNGMLLDEEDWIGISKAKVIELDKLETELDTIICTDTRLSELRPAGIQADLFGAPVRQTHINYASPTQIKKVCATLGLKVDSTDDRELTKLIKVHRFFSVLQKYRETAKILSTYGEKFLRYINPNTGRIHTDFWQVKDTGRVSSGSKEMNAPNVQNLPADNLFRNCFKARLGFKWVSIDYSGERKNWHDYCYQY